MEAIRINPNFTDAYNNLGVVLERQGHHAQAIKNYQKVIQLDPKFLKGYFNLGIIHSNMKLLQEGMSFFQKSY